MLNSALFMSRKKQCSISRSTGHLCVSGSWKCCLPVRNQVLTVAWLGLLLLSVLHAICPTGKRIWTVPGSSILWLYWNHRYRFIRLPVLCSLRAWHLFILKSSVTCCGQESVVTLRYSLSHPSLGQASVEKVMQHLCPAPGWARHMTLAQKGLKAAVPAGPGSAAPLGCAGEKLEQGRCCWNGCAWSDGGEGGEGLQCGHRACWSGNQHVAEESWFHSYLSPPASGVGRRHADPCPLGLLTVRADESLMSETGQWAQEADLPHLFYVEETLQWSDSSWIPQSPCRAYFNQLSVYLWLLFCFTFIKLAANVQHVVFLLRITNSPSRVLISL